MHPVTRIPVLLLLTCLRISAAPEIVPAGGNAEFILTDETITGLSGLTWVGGDHFVAVSDRERALIPVRLTIDPDTGAITAGRFEAPLPLPSAASDFEDLTFDAGTGNFFISAEDPPSIEAWSAAGELRDIVLLPDIFRSARTNLSMEALTIDPATGALWTASEDTLAADGDVSSARAGGLIRLLEFDAGRHPRRQFAWRTEPSSLRPGGSGSGVSGLCRLPGGELLVLERVLSGLSVELVISAAGFTGADEVSGTPSLAGTPVSPATRQQLFRRNCGFTNYEGITSGPVLSDGSHTLILVADSGRSHRHSFLALRAY